MTEPKAVVQRYRFRVVTNDGRNVLSHEATVTRPQPPPPLAFADVAVHQILVAINAAKQGDLHASAGFTDLKGTVPKHQFSTEEFEYSVISPRDPQSGLPTGQRMHKPVVFTAALGPATPQLFAALCTNELLPTVVFDCYGHTTQGKTVLAHSVKLTNAAIASIDLVKPNLRNTQLSKEDERQQIALTFSQIELTNGVSTAADNR